MSRVIKFRGIDIVTGEMRIGGGIDNQRDTPIIIIHGNRSFVDANTVGQFTGLKDKNGVEIYKGDYLQSNCGDGEEYNLGTVEWFGPWQGWAVVQRGLPYSFGDKDSVTADYKCNEILVVGNKYQGYQS